MQSFADAKVHPVDWLVEEFFPRRAVIFITAPTGMGKSTLMLHLALSVLTGRPWFGFTCTQGKVAYWDQDNPDSHLTENRLCAIAAGMNLSEIPREPLSCLFRTRHRIDKEGKQLLGRLKDFGASVLFLDTFASINPFNENDNTLMSQVMVDYLFPFAEAGITVIALHHPAKEILLATPRQLKAYQRQGPNAARGATGIPAACGTTFNMVLDDQKRVTLVNAKPRYGNPPALSILYDEHGQMGSADWRITLKPAKPQASQESAEIFIQGMPADLRAEMSSRRLVEMMTDNGYFMSQSTASRALKKWGESAPSH